MANSEEEGEQEETTSPGNVLENLLERFPALQELGERLTSRQIPYIQMLTAMECGPACLTAVLNYFGKGVSIQEIRGILNAAHGVDAQSLLDAARVFGLNGRGVTLEVDQLEYLEPGSILHWNFSHFVVFERLTRNAVIIMDPATGRRSVPLDDFRKAFTGVTLLLEPGEDFVQRKKDETFFWRNLKSALADRGLWLRILVTSGLLQVFMLSVPLVTGMIVDTIVPLADQELLWVLASGMFLMVVLHFIGSLVRGHLLLHLRAHMDARMTPGFMHHMTQLPYPFFQQIFAGDLSYLLNSTYAIRDLLTATVLTGLIDGTLVLSYFVILMWVSPSLAFLTLALGGTQVLIYLSTLGQQRELAAQEIHAGSEASSKASDMLFGIESLKGLGVESRAVQNWTGYFVRMANVQLKKGEMLTLVDSLIGSLRFGSPLFVLGIGAYKVLNGEMGLGTMLALSALAMGVLEPLHSLLGVAIQLEVVKQHIIRLDRVLSLPTERAGQAPRPPRKVHGAIAMEEVSFRYGPLVPHSVEKVSLDIRPGMFVALVGKSGSGKSTLAALMAGLQKPSAGRILYDGEDLEEMDLVATRRQLGYVPQKPYMLSDSIKANVGFLDATVDMEAITRACKRACIHDEIVQMPMGYETILIGDGGTISGGQKQRIALARALVRQPAILLLDEATSALDSLTERAVMKQLEALKCTRIVVAHRLSTVMNADVILVVDQGQIVEQGTHLELIARGGRYHELVSLQAEAA